MKYRNQIIVYMRMLGYSYALIGELWDVTRERIRQILIMMGESDLVGRLPSNPALIEYGKFIRSLEKEEPLEDYGEYNFIRDRVYKFGKEGMVEEQIEKYKVIKSLADEGLWLKEISRRTGFHWLTVRRFGERYGIEFVSGRTARFESKEKV